MAESLALGKHDMGEAKLTLENLLDRQRKSWKAGSPIKVDEIVRQFPALKEREDFLIDLLYAEVLLREENGDAPARSDYTILFPYLKEKIDRQFQVHEALDVPATPQAEIATSVGGETIPSSSKLRALGKHSVPGFELQEVVGRGGSGIAYKARDEKLDRTVVIKFLLASEDKKARKRLLHEASASASLQHPSIVRVFQVGTNAEDPYMVMEYVDGGSLAEKLRDGPLQTTEAITIAKQVSEAVQYAHSNSVIHRDVKPGNILLDSKGSAQVADFGLARKLGDESLHATGDVLGTPAYMSPEQAKGQPADTRSDVYSIGAVVYEMLCGRSPFDAATPWDILHQVTTADPVSIRQLNASLPKDLETICQKCLEKDPSRRYQSAQLLVEDLERFEKGEPILARPVNSMQRLMKWFRRQPGLASMAAVSLGLLLALAAGSTYAALRLNAANKTILHEQKLAKDAQLEAEQGREVAKIAQSQAEKDRESVIEAHWQLVNSLYEDLSANAATIETREKVLMAAIEGLESIGELRGTRNFDRTAVSAHRKIAGLYSMKGNNKSAVENYELAIAVARENANRNPDDIEIQQDLLVSIGDLATHYVKVSNYAEVAKHKAEANEILRKLREENPDDIELLRRAVVGYSRDIDYLWQHQPPKESIKLGEIAAVDAALLIELDPDNEMAWTAGYQLHSRLGRASVESGDLDATIEHWRIARKYIEHLLEINPDNPQYVYGNAVLHRMESTVPLAQARFEASLDSLRVSIELFKKLAAQDPKNLNWKTNIANSLTMQSQTLAAMGKLDESIAGYDEAVEIHLGNAEKTGVTLSHRGMLTQIKFEQALIKLRQRKWAEAKELIDDMKRQVDGEGEQAPIVGMTGDYASFCYPLVAEATEILQGNPCEITTVDSEVAALFLVACVEAESNIESKFSQRTKDRIRRVNPELNCSTFDELFEHINGLEGCHQATLANIVLYHARVLSIRGNHLDEVAEIEEATRISRQLELAQKIDTLFLKTAKPALEVNRSIRTEPELQWFVDTETYQNSSLNQ